MLRRVALRLLRFRRVKGRLRPAPERREGSDRGAAAAAAAGGAAATAAAGGAAAAGVGNLLLIASTRALLAFAKVFGTSNVSLLLSFTSLGGNLSMPFIRKLFT